MENFFKSQSELKVASINPKPSFKSGWNRNKLFARLRAALVHLGLSALVALVVSIPLVLWLYPSPYFEAAGGRNLLAMILAIDVVVGPMLTFLVFDRSKSSLKNDLRIIGLVQFVALGFGVHAALLSRPVYISFVVDRFELVSAAQVDPEELSKAPMAMQVLAWGKPQLAYARQPNDPKLRSELALLATQGDIDLKQMFRYYRPFAEATEQIIQRASPIKELERFNAPALVKTLLAEYQSQTLAYLPVQGKKSDLTAIVNARTGELLAVVALQPWQISE